MKIKLVLLSVAIMLITHAYAQSNSSEESAKTNAMAMGEVTYQYVVDDNGKLTLWRPLRSRLLLDKDSKHTVDQREKMVEEALKQNKDVTLFDFGGYFKAVGTVYGELAKMGANKVVEVVNSDLFKKTVDTAVTAGKAAAKAKSEIEAAGKK